MERIKCYSVSVYELSFFDFILSVLLIGIMGFFPVQIPLTLPFRVLGSFSLFCMNEAIKQTSKYILILGLVFILLKLVVAILLKKRFYFSNIMLLVMCVIEILAILQFYIPSIISASCSFSNVFIGLIAFSFYIIMMVAAIFNLKNKEYKAIKEKNYSIKELWDGLCNFSVVYFTIETVYGISIILDQVFCYEKNELFKINVFNVKTNFLFNKWVSDNELTFLILPIFILLMQIILIVLVTQKNKTAGNILIVFYIVDLILSIYKLDVICILVYAFFIVMGISRNQKLTKRSKDN